MAVLHRATLSPSKLELLTPWLAGRSWSGETGELEQLGAYRFDDAMGEVGVETFLLGTPDGRVLHVPVTYRAAPVEGAEADLVGTMEHSVLGPRWVYDGCADPVWAAELLTVVLTGGTQAALFLDGGSDPLPATSTVQGSGTDGTPVEEVTSVSWRDDGDTTVVRAGSTEIVLARVVGADVAAGQTLTGRWADGGPATLAGVRDA
ncbi:MAG: hypothetical protein ABIQ59_00715 [Nocardioidaceae bacterium]